LSYERTIEYGNDAASPPTRQQFQLAWSAALQVGNYAASKPAIMLVFNFFVEQAARSHRIGNVAVQHKLAMILQVVLGEEFKS
jgi:hypothetical protein